MSLFSRKSLRELALQAVIVIAAVTAPSTAQPQAIEKRVLTKKAKSHHKHTKKAAKEHLPAKHKSAKDAAHKQKNISGEVTLICELPYTITKSGRYCLKSKENVLFASNVGAAITVQADNVDIDLAGHTINLAGFGTTAGIAATNVVNLFVHDGAITGLNANFLGNETAAFEILLNNVSQATFKNLSLTTQNECASISGCTNLLFSKCTFDALANSASIVLEASSTFEDVTVEECTFLNTSGSMNLNHIAASGSGNGLTVSSCTFDNALIPIETSQEANVANIEISDCSFTNAEVAIILANAQNSRVHNCSFNVYAFAVAFLECQNMLVNTCDFQFFGQDGYVNNGSFVLFRNSLGAIVRNCTMSNTQTCFPSIFEPVYILSSQDVLIDRCVIDGNSNANTFGATPANIHIAANPSTPSSDIKIRNSVIRGNATYGIFCDGTESAVAPTAIEIDNCLIDGALAAGVFFGNALTCTIENCEISGTTSGPGISLTDGSQYITMQSNTVVNNSAQGITLDLTSSNNDIAHNIVTDNLSDGIFIGSCFNTVSDNTVSRNGGIGINNLRGCNSEFYGNSSCNNGANTLFNNCKGLPAGQVISPGGASVAGGNICCP
ncbi:MAG: right-handed parallel beta-helix repeat-containing protein [Verrucomicrobia bacterium]|nr:right-handed parallel beta-helix repeat-containing protein [Verrucomicrobiota bacterium]